MGKYISKYRGSEIDSILTNSNVVLFDDSELISETEGADILNEITTAMMELMTGSKDDIFIHFIYPDALYEKIMSTSRIGINVYLKDPDSSSAELFLTLFLNRSWSRLQDGFAIGFDGTFMQFAGETIRGKYQIELCLNRNDKHGYWITSKIKGE